MKGMTMCQSLKNLEAEAKYAIAANGNRRALIKTVMDSNSSELNPVVHSLLSTLYARLGNDSLVMKKLVTELKTLSDKDQKTQSE